MTHRADQQPAQADVLSRADDQEIGILGLPPEHWRGIVGEARQGPAGLRLDCDEESADVLWRP